MKIIKAKTKQELLQKIETNLNGTDEEVYISLRPTLEIIMRILEKSPGVRKISCPHSLYLQVSRKVFRVLEGKGVKLEPGEFKVGRPNKYDEDTIAMMITARKNGKTAKQISEEFEIPLRTVYYYLKQEKIK